MNDIMGSSLSRYVCHTTQHSVEKTKTQQRSNVQGNYASPITNLISLLGRFHNPQCRKA